MRWDDIDWHPSRRKLRQFAALAVVVFGAMAIWQWFMGSDSSTAPLFLAIAATAAVLGLVAPAALGPVFVAWTVVAFPIGWLVSKTVLLFLFVGLVTPLALLFRLWRRDLLELRKRPDRTTYWRQRPQPADDTAYLRQY
jgi:hypothetical protein